MTTERELGFIFNKHQTELQQLRAKNAELQKRCEELEGLNRIANADHMSLLRKVVEARNEAEAAEQQLTAAREQALADRSNLSLSEQEFRKQLAAKDAKIAELTEACKTFAQGHLKLAEACDKRVAAKDARIAWLKRSIFYAYRLGETAGYMSSTPDVVKECEDKLEALIQQALALQDNCDCDPGDCRRGK